MDLTNSFTVPADIGTAWATLLDVEAIAPCMPGAKLDSVDGDDFSGTVKVKLGPVSLTYGGDAKFLEKNQDKYVAVIEGTGKETRGTGTAKATVTTTLVAESDNVTRVDVATNLTITGKAAQFGRGVMQDVAGRLVDQFAKNLEGVIAARVAGPESPATGDSAEGQESASVQTASTTSPSTTSPSTTSPSTTSPSTTSPSGAAPAEALDLGAVAAGPVLKRAVPVIVGVVAVAALIWWVTSRRR